MAVVVFALLLFVVMLRYGAFGERWRRLGIS